ncbi:MAG: hypothetical protein KBF36_05700 [Chitinophagaceae bacterium]|nr:hypothetical protein [Chitinophagaceae bacterium]MBP9740738.1 hypothetical protein [Chitinophagaceae bacterium]
MNYLFTCFFIFCSLVSFGQRSNYNSFIIYDDEYLDKILSAERYTISEYLFYGTIKSVYIEQFDKSGRFSGSPSKVFFDKNKNTAKRINYNNNLEDYGAVEFYYLPKYGGNPIIKSSYESVNGEIRNIITSEIDTINHIVINNRFVNNKLNEIDTIFYIKDYKPIEIRTSNVKYINKSVRKIAYFNNDKIYKEVYQRNSSSLGSYIKYNKSGKRLYLYKIKFDEFDNIAVENEDNNKEKEQEFIWYNDKDFEFHEKINTTITFNYKEKKLHKRQNESTYTTFFNKNLLPIKKLSVDKKYGLNMEIIFDYNKYNDLITEKIKNEDSPMIMKTYKYLYDDKSNWTERKEYENGKLIFTTKRQIEYE